MMSHLFFPMSARAGGVADRVGGADGDGRGARAEPGRGATGQAREGQAPARPVAQPARLCALARQAHQRTAGLVISIYGSLRTTSHPEVFWMDVSETGWCAVHQGEGWRHC